MIFTEPVLARLPASWVITRNCRACHGAHPGLPAGLECGAPARRWKTDKRGKVRAA